MKEEPHEAHYVCMNCGSLCILSSEEYDGDEQPSVSCPYLNGNADWKVASLSTSRELRPASEEGKGTINLRREV